MPSFISITVAVILLAGTIVAQERRDVSDCPGLWYVAASAASGCCVGGTLAPVVLSTCPGWLVCSGPATTTTTHTPLSCATIISATDSDYSSKVIEASKSLQASGTHFQTAVNENGSAITAGPQSGSPTATQTGGSAASTASQSSGAASGSSGSSGANANHIVSKFGVLRAFGVALLVACTQF
ncbi:hypothetical protein H2200_008219 [Cladophialophora chaetospira]|uniref:Uncharacterized protein n=1 Tax=Cladophialophora chaetospira TaxID=386627 RepID=A0AA38X5F9_9EURO|nr:hypothetical protein H2200_008219 [Cladophialophora chaetospira]